MKIIDVVYSPVCEATGAMIEKVEILARRYGRTNQYTAISSPSIR